MVNTSGAFYVLDNEAPNPNPTGASSQLLPYTLGNNGALQPETSGVIPDDPTLSNPIYIMLESKGHFLYVANQGNNITGNNTESGISGYFITTAPAYQATFIAGQPFGSGSGPQCIVEDPSNQFVYTANFNDSSITGHTIDVNSGVLDNLRNTNNYVLPGPATWCLIDGRTS
jgi:DNA-binding beta-propeller fold protein YncE